MEIEWTTAPGKPTDLKPSGGRAVSLAKPVLAWTFVDSKGEFQSQYQVQIDDDSGFAAPLYDSGYIVSTEWEHDLSLTAFAGLANDDVRYWRVRVKDNYGLESPWSDPVSFARKTKGALVITNPPDEPNNTVEETTPPLQHDFTGRTQKLAQWFIQKLDDDEWVTVLNSGRVATTEETYTPPAGKIVSTVDEYREVLRVWDDVARESTPGDPAYVQLIRYFTYVRSGTPAPVETLDVSNGGGDDAPGVLLEWTRTLQPDFFSIMVDGRQVARVEAADVLVAGDDYRYVLYLINPRKTHSFEVEAVVLDAGKYKHSDGNPIVNFKPEPTGYWLVAPRYGLRTVLTGKEAQDKQIGGSATVFNPIGGRRDPVRIRDSVRGYEGQLIGRITPAFTETGLTWLTRLERIVGLPHSAEIWLVGGVNTFRVVVGEPMVNDLSHDRWEVTIPFWQVDDFTVPLKR
jgi:hypothetical protein